MNVDEVVDFFTKCRDESGRIARMILDDKEGYIEAKRKNPAWSALTLELSIFQQQSQKLLSIFKYSFKEGGVLMIDGIGPKEGAIE